MYKLEIDGDSREINYAKAFIKAEFPAYEEFWQRYIVRLTNRPSDLHFKDANGLAAVGCGDQEIQVAQLHYSVLVHLAAAWDIRQQKIASHKELSWAMFSLVSAQDVATELLARVLLSGNNYRPFYNRSSKKAREDWVLEKKYKWPTDIAAIRTYRNNLAHGHVFPSEDRGTLTFPIIGKESQYRDWRPVIIGRYNPADFEPGDKIVDGAWKATLDYLQSIWANDLLSHKSVASLSIPQKPSGTPSTSITVIGLTSTSGTTIPLY